MTARRECQTIAAAVRDGRGRRPAPAVAGGADAILPGEYAGIALRRPFGRCYPPGPSAPGRSRVRPSDTRISGDLERRPADAGDPSEIRASPVLRDPARSADRRPIRPSSTMDRDTIDRMDAKQVWRAALGELQVSLSPANFETWLRDTQLVDVDDQRFRIAVPNGFAKDWLETRYRSLISQTLARIVGYSVQVEFAIVPAAPAATPGDERRRPDRAAPRPRSASSPARVGGEGGTTNLNPRYTFANFIVGSANRLAHAASLSVAERPGHAYNPLFLYGGVGLGKTHLMHAIGNQVDRQVPAQAGRLRDEREVHERVHHLDPAGQDRRVPGPLPADRPPPHRRHPVHRRQGADPGRVLPHVQRDPRGRQADRPVARTGRRRRS